jgi:predicted TPR repeat methyltransferase
MADRVTVMAGDFSTDSIGQGYDLVWTSFALNFFRNDLDPIIRKVHDALNPGGVFVNLAESLTDERTQPTTMINQMLLSRSDLMFDEGEIAQSMLRVGFKSVHSRPLTDLQPHGPVMVEVARK